jgi:hypothetical protein
MGTGERIGIESSDQTHMLHLSENEIQQYAGRTLTRDERIAVSEHLAACKACRSKLAQLSEVRERATALFREVRGGADLAHRDQQVHEQEHVLPSTLLIFRRYGTALACALALSLGGWFCYQHYWVKSGLTAAAEFAVVDGKGTLRLNQSGFSNISLPAPERTLLDGLVRQGLGYEELQINPALADLRSASVILMGPDSKSPTFQVLRPVRTILNTPRPVFSWSAAPGASSYTVTVVADDRSQAELMASPPIPASRDNRATYQWTVPETNPLVRGKRYRWYVTAVVGDQEIDSPGTRNPDAMFSILSESERQQLDALTKVDPPSRLIRGLASLRAGLLDDAQDDFEALANEPAQSVSGKRFIEQVLSKIRTLKR